MKDRHEVECDLRNWLQIHYSVIGAAEALRIGASRSLIRSKLDRGEWARIFEGVYRDTAAPDDPHQALRGACVYTRVGVASHASAAWHWGLLDRPPETPHVTVAHDCRRGSEQTRLTVHRSRDLDLEKTVEWKHILVTNPLRTLVDLAGAAPAKLLTEAVDSAVARHLVTPAALDAEIERLAQRGRDGIGALRRHLEERGYSGAPAPSVLEAHARRLVGRTGLPMPKVEQRVATDVADYRVDMTWTDVGFITEFDGYSWHFSPEHKERDEKRRQALRQKGWTVLVYDWRQIVRQPERTGQEIVDAYLRLAQVSLIPPGGGPG